MQTSRGFHKFLQEYLAAVSKVGRSPTANVGQQPVTV
jgi:hypothetical protein